MRVLALTPARGGSKGVPGKNIRKLGDHPLIAHSIIAAKACRIPMDMVVTTDDPAIARVAEDYGARVILRPETLAADDTPMMPVVSHALSVLRAEGADYDCLVLLQPTCPLRLPEDIAWSVERLERGDVDGVISVTEASHEHPARMYRIERDRLLPLDTSMMHVNRQDLPVVFNRSGVLYTVRIRAMEREGTLFPAKSAPYVMPRERSINIDEPLDWIIAEAVHAHLKADAHP